MTAERKGLSHFYSRSHSCSA